jgi:hypothetical protein
MSEASPSTLSAACNDRSHRVTERRPHPRQAAREAATKSSRGVPALLAGLRSAKGLALGLTAVGAVAGLLMILTELTPVAKVDVPQGSCEVINDVDPDLADRCVLSGFERHGGAFIVLGALAVAMAYGAGAGGSRPAAVALIAIGLIVMAFTLLADLPETSRTGAIGPRFEGATGQAGIGFWLELAAGLLATGAGALAFSRQERA